MMRYTLNNYDAWNEMTVLFSLTDREQLEPNDLVIVPITPQRCKLILKIVLQNPKHIVNSRLVKINFPARPDAKVQMSICQDVPCTIL